MLLNVNTGSSPTWTSPACVLVSQQALAPATPTKQAILAACCAATQLAKHPAKPSTASAELSLHKARPSWAGPAPSPQQPATLSPPESLALPALSLLPALAPCPLLPPLFPPVPLLPFPVTFRPSLPLPLSSQPLQLPLLAPALSSSCPFTPAQQPRRQQRGQPLPPLGTTAASPLPPGPAPWSAQPRAPPPRACGA